MCSQRKQHRCESSQLRQLLGVSNCFKKQVYVHSLYYTFILSHVFGYLSACAFPPGRVPDEPQTDMTTSPAGSGENLGLFMLRKDSERRDTLHRILTEYIDHVVENIRETLPQVHTNTAVSPFLGNVWCGMQPNHQRSFSEVWAYDNVLIIFPIFQAEEHSITSEHISELIGCLGENIRSPDKRHLTNSLLKLRSALMNDAVPLSSLQAALFSFQDAVCALLSVCC